MMFCTSSILPYLIAGVAYTQVTVLGVSKCSTKELRRSVLGKMLDALQCDDYACGKYTVHGLLQVIVCYFMIYGMSSMLHFILNVVRECK